MKSLVDSTDIMRNRAFANHHTMTDQKNRRLAYYINTSSGNVASNPNTLRDQGKTRNAEYHIGDDMDAHQAKNMTWKELLDVDK